MTTTNVATLIGKTLDSPEVKSFTKQLKVSPKVSEDDGDIYHEYKRAGVIIAAESEGKRVTDIFLYADGVDGYTGYGAPLPEGVSFTMDRAKVESLLGASLNRVPRRTKWERGTHGLVIDFTPEGRIKFITLTGA